MPSIAMISAVFSLCPEVLQKADPPSKSRCRDIDNYVAVQRLYKLKPETHLASGAEMQTGLYGRLKAKCSA
eukprot:37027-Alexandrium_andersonii.AAC.1